MPDLPAGTVTFLFTDIEGSTKLWETQPDAMQIALERHDALMQDAIETNGGIVFKTIGDAFCAVFATATEALEAALAAQLSLCQITAGVGSDLIKVRMALHTGAVESRNDDYFGPPLNRIARLLAAGHGGQVLLSQATYVLVRDRLPNHVSLTDMGEHRLKDLQRAEQVFQLCCPDLPADFPPLKSLDHLPNNIPRQLTSFIGRQKETAEIEALLENASLLTLTGSGGCGKTRLSLQVAADVLDQYSQGVWFVELASISDPALLPQAVAEPLNIRESATEPILKTLLSALKERQMLLVLDNCEHVLDASARLVDAILRGCPKVKILLSSREALGIGGETSYRVPSLSLPDPKMPLTPASLPNYESVALFIDRASQVQTGFAVTERNAQALASICHRLDGIPLAIELAAARARSLSVEDIDNKLDHRFRLLTGGSRTALPRQQTLRSLIDWSYDLLNDAEKALLCRLSMFAGGWSLEAAEAICGWDGENAGEGETWDYAITPLSDEVLDLLTSLCDKSLVAAELHDTSIRYRLLETVRQYARDRLLEGGDGERWRGRHLEHYLSIAEEAEPLLYGPDQQMWLERLETEHDNLRAALDWGQNTEHLALRLAASLCGFWEIHGHLFEGRERITRALLLVSGETAAVRAKALNGAGLLAAGQGDFAAAQAFYEESQEINQGSNNKRGMATSMIGLGNVAQYSGDYSAASALYEESLSIGREIGDNRRIAAGLSNLGNVAEASGDFAAARELYEQGLNINKEMGNVRGVAMRLQNLASVAYNQGDLNAARVLVEESITIKRTLGDRQGIANSLRDIGLVAFNQGDYTAARVHYEESLSIYRDLGVRNGVAEIMANLGNVARELGDYVSARALLEESLAILRDICHRSGIGLTLNNLGIVARNQGDYAAARAFYEEGLAIYRKIGNRTAIAGGLNNLGDIYQTQGNDVAAQLFYEECLVIFRELSHKMGIAISLKNLGVLAERRGDFMLAHALHSESLSMRRDLGDKSGIASSLEAFATLAAAETRSLHAAALWGAAALLREQISAPLAPADICEHEKQIAKARAALRDDAAFASAREKGRGMTMEEAIAMALNGASS